MVGSAIIRHLSQNDYEIITRSRRELDLTDNHGVRHFLQNEKIDLIYLAAAKVGGIHANNNYPADFITENLAIELNVIQSAHQANIQRLLFLGSSCIYPKHAKQPISETALLSGTLEPTNEPYAIAKIAGIKLCESFNRQYGTDYRCVMPTNLYGPNDNFHPQNSHVIPGLMQRLHHAKLSESPGVTIWGTGTPRREFLHVDDLASACVHVANLGQDKLNQHTSTTCSHINIGTGYDVSIKDLAELMAKIIGYAGTLNFDRSKPDGAPRKLLDVTRAANLGWRYKTELSEGLRQTYRWYVDNFDELKSQ